MATGVATKPLPVQLAPNVTNPVTGVGGPNRQLTTPGSAFYGLSPLSGQNLMDVYGVLSGQDPAARQRVWDTLGRDVGDNYINAYSAGGPMYNPYLNRTSWATNLRLGNGQATLANMPSWINDPSYVPSAAELKQNRLDSRQPLNDWYAANNLPEPGALYRAQQSVTPGATGGPAPVNPWTRTTDIQNPWFGSGGTAPVVTPTVPGSGTIPTTPTTPTTPVTTTPTPTPTPLTTGTPMPKQPIKPGGTFSTTAPAMTGIQGAQTATPIPGATPMPKNPIRPGGTTSINAPLRTVWS